MNGKSNGWAKPLLPRHVREALVIKAETEEYRYDQTIALIEEGSRNPYGHRRQRDVQHCIDDEILRGFMDPDEIDNEARIEACAGEDDFEASHILDDSTLVTFEENCECRDHNTCIKCCTGRDLLALTDLTGDRIAYVRAVAKEFELHIPVWAAQKLGFI